ncbi:MAG: bifunctional DNA primase/polymerase [Novosphingobium sp.]|nr:bifunctional DNA primase/polymerase [Novosphingobium sp.]
MTGRNFITGSALMQAGVAVFPCRELGASVKAPYINGGFKQATTDILIGEVWGWKFPHAVWGLPCALNNVLVLDADRHGNGDGVANLLALFAQHEFDWRDVPTVATPNGGFHFYFNRPAGLGPTKAHLCEAVLGYRHLPPADLHLRPATGH